MRDEGGRTVETPLDEAASASARAAGRDPDASVVVPTHRRPDELARVFEALERQTLPLDRFEVIVVDDASPQEAWDAVSRAASATAVRARAIRLPSNQGPAAARNAGARLARAPLILFLDDDCVPVPEWAQSFVAAFADGADLVQGHTRADPGVVAGPFGRTIWVTGQSWLFESCNIGYRKASFEALGGFDESRPEVAAGSRPHFGEDAELGWRLRKAGMRATFAPHALAHHTVYPTTFVQWLAELRRRSLFPGLVRRCPGIRRGLVAGLFLSNETAAFDLALAGAIAALASWNPWTLFAELPWVWTVLRRALPHRDRPLLVRIVQFALGDVVSFWSLLKGSVSARTIVL